MNYIDVALTALAPMLTELLATALSALLALLLLAVRKYVGLKGEAILRDGLNQAIRTGAAQTSADGATATAIEGVVTYAKRSAPEAIKKLGASDDILRAKARAAFNEIWGR